MMTEYEVKTIWRNRGLPEKQMIRVLAELNACTDDVMIDFMENIGIDLTEQAMQRGNRRRKGIRMPWTESEERLVMEKLKEKWPFPEIARVLNRSVNSVRQHYYDYISKRYEARW